MTARINLLPWRQWERDRRKRVFLGGLALSGLATVAVVVLAVALFDRLIDNQEQRNRFLLAHIAELDTRIAEIDRLRRRRDFIGERVRLLDRLRSDRSNPVRIFDELARTLVSGVHYAALAKRGPVITARGSAESPDRISALMRGLDESSAFEAPRLRGIEQTQANAAYGPQTAVFELDFRATGQTPAEGR